MSMPAPAVSSQLSDLAYELRRLHREAGEPGVRVLAELTGGTVSRDTVHRVLRCGTTGKLPRWAPLEAVILALNGDVNHFRILWISCRDAEGSARTSTAATEPTIQPPVVTHEEPPTPPPTDHAGDTASIGLAAHATATQAAKDLAARLIPLGIRRTFDSNDILLREGEVDNAVRLVLDGWVRESVVTEDGREVLLGLRGPGELLGLDAALHPRPQASSIRALEPVSCVQISSARFEGVMRSNPDVALAVARFLSDRVRQLSSMVTDRANLDGSQRVAKALLDLAAQNDQGNSDEPLTIGMISQEDIAAMAGMARRTVARTLRMFRDRDIISTGGRRIEILRPQVLRAFARSDPMR